MDVLPFGLKKNAGQVASLIIMALSVFLFLSAVGISYSQKKIIFTKARIAADAGSIYLASQIGSYAHYLSKKYVKGKCKRKKHDFGILGAIIKTMLGTMLIIIGAYTDNGALMGLGISIIAFAWGSYAIDQIIQYRQARQLNRMFRKLSSLDYKRYIKWDTIAYTAMIACEDPGVVEAVNSHVSAIVNALEGASSSEAFNQQLEDINNAAFTYLSTTGMSFVNNVNIYRNSLLSALKQINSMVYYGQQLFGTQTIKECRDSDGDGECDCVDNNYNGICDDEEDDNEDAEEDDDPDYIYMVSTIVSDVDYIDRKLYGTGEITDMIYQAVNDSPADSILVLNQLYDYECRKEGRSCQDGVYVLEQIENILNNIYNRIPGLTTLSGLTLCTPCPDPPEAPTPGCSPYCYGTHIVYSGNPYVTINDIYYNRPCWMLPEDFNQLKADLRDRVANMYNVIHPFITSLRNEGKSILRQWSEAYDDEEEGEVDSSAAALFDPPTFNYNWTDKLGRSHSLAISVSFKLPKIKVKKKLFYTKIKVKRCKQTVKVHVNRNGRLFRGHMHYKANHSVNNTEYWYMKTGSDER